ncbi:MAG: DUF3667 domain-containing protein [Erythrobacter sp.]|nr:DUF3667 domain-containing protein [Erythrobacter sp.]
MSDLIEGLGTAGEGGLFARAIEPHSGAKDRHPHQPENCLNCGTPLVGAYCHACGQLGHVHRTIGAFMHDLLHGALHFEGKLWRTLPMLVFRPGALTRRYIAGERARFVSPMALFLFGVFLMFAVFQMVGITAPTDLPGVEAAQVRDQVQAGAQAQVDTLRERLAQEGLTEQERAALQSQIDGLELLLANEAGDAADTTSAEADAGVSTVGTGQDIEASDSIVRADFSDLPSSAETGVEWFDHAVEKWRTNPGLMLYKLQSNAYKFSWLLIPLSLPFVWLLFLWKPAFKGYDHAIFVTYSLSFMTLLFIAASILGALGVPAEVILPVVMVIPPIHLYKQLRGAYQLSRFSAFWRLMMLSMFIWIIITLFVQALLLLGAF